eukprot:COSAG02_NODE_7741_length_2866_cov_1.542630_5_plen_69_part_00
MRRCRRAEAWWLVKPLAAVASHLSVRQRLCHGMPSRVSSLLHQQANVINNAVAVVAKRTVRILENQRH